MKNYIIYITYTVVLLSALKGRAQGSYLDTGFGTNGIATAVKFEPKAVCIQQDGKILVGGGINVPGSFEDYIILRFNTDGTPDTGFGTNGKVQAGIADRSEVIVGIAQLPNGKILAVGTSSYIGGGDASQVVTFLRLNVDGNFDSSFGNGGFLNRGFGEMRSIPFKMAMLPDGKVLVAGSYRIPATGGAPPPRPAVARFNANIGYDTSFNGTGSSVPNYFSGAFRTIDILSDGGIIGVPYSGESALSNITIFKFLESGQLDPTFGEDGRLLLNLGVGKVRVSEIKEHGDGFLLTGLIEDGITGAAMFRLLPDGTPDTAYGTQGILQIGNTSGQNEKAVQSLILENGDVITGLQRWNNEQSGYDYGFMRTNAGGMVDTSFGNEGYAVTGIVNNQMLCLITRQPDGKILAAGFDESNMVLMRYDISGALKDPSYEKAQIAVYPNPATDKVTISGLPENTPVTLYNISGQKVLEVTANGDTLIDISSLAKGIYFVNTAKGAAKIIKE